MGFLGASLRYLLELALPSQGGFPYATLIVNIFGCFTLEIINQYVGRRLHLPGPLVKSLGIGLVGAFTTLSAFSTECLGFFRDGEVELAAAYIAITIFVTFIASLCGKIASNYLALHRLRRIRKKRAAERFAKKSTVIKGGRS
jgi:CrcB protein